MGQQEEFLPMDEQGLTEFTQQMIRTPSVSLEEKEVAENTSERIESEAASTSDKAANG